MLKTLGYYGTYRNKDMSVGIMLENPLNYNLDATVLVFGVMVTPKSNAIGTLHMEDLTFYLMDEKDCLYNAQNASYSSLSADIVADTEEAPHAIKGLIQAKFKPDYLYQDLRIVFYCRLNNRMEIIHMEY